MSMRRFASPRDTLAHSWMMFVGGAKLRPRCGRGSARLAVAGASRSTAFPLAHFHHAAALALLGHLNEARAATQAGLALDPGFTLRRLRVNSSSDNPIYLAGANVSIRPCAWLGCPRIDVGDGSNGQRVSGPQVGAIAVMSRGRRGGHVGIITGVDAKGNPIMISGNNGNRVREAPVSRGRIYAYVMPTS